MTSPDTRPTRRDVLKIMAGATTALALPRTATEARTVPFALPQPTPIKTTVARHPTATGHVTSIHRRFAAGSSRFCQLCPRGCCSASDDECLVSVDGFVPVGSAALFSCNPDGDPTP